MLGHFGQYHLCNRNAFYTRWEGTYSLDVELHLLGLASILADHVLPGACNKHHERNWTAFSLFSRENSLPAGKKRSSAREKDRNGTSTETGDFVRNISRIISPFVHARRNKYLLSEQRGACTLLKLRYERKRRDKYELHAAESHNGA